MKPEQRLWTREELILVMNLYCKLPFGRLHRLNPEVINLAKLLNRTSGAVAYKLVNFASFDPTLKARGINGASNASNLDKRIWDEFFNNWDILPFESERLLAEFSNTTVEDLNHISENEIFREGLTKEQMVKIRVNQRFFRTLILASYNSTCCITGIKQPELLIASHIKPWSTDEKNRLNPQNGIAINALHDRAFETGLITITPEYKIKVSSVLFDRKESGLNEDYFLKYHNQGIILPSKFLPDRQFLEYHNESRFRK